MEMARRLKHEHDLLWGLIDQRIWVLRSNLPHWVVLQVPCKRDCAYAARHFPAALAELKAGTAELYFEIDNEIYQATNQGDLMQAESPQPLSPLIGGAIQINRQLLDAFGMMLDPDRSIGLVRLSDERQISVSGGAGGKFLVGLSLDQAVQLKRAQYWHPQDLIEFNRIWRQEMSVGSGQWLEWRYRSFDPLADNPGPDKCDYTFITKYKLIEGPEGVLYHVAENLDMVEI